MKKPSRRELLKTGALAGAAGFAGSLIPGCGLKGGGITGVTGSSSCGKLTDIEHVVIMMLENRSFDHYFGTYKGVRGFNDQSAAYNQPYPPNTSSAPSGVLLPYHLDTTTTNASCTHDITHDWVPQHQSWDSGKMDGFVTSRLAINANDAVLSMGYYTRADLPFYYALADAFTLCDNYYCSVIGPTDPNRLYSMAASIDPDGKNGGPIVQTLVSTRAEMIGKLTYTTMPEQLQARGISWKVYNSPDQNVLNGVYSDNVLPYFKNFQDPSGVLFKNAFGPQFPTDFVADAAAGNLPQVTWIVPSVVDSDHPPSPALFGEATVSAVVSALTANPAAWAKTVLFITYDENGGFFDHVPPPTAPAGTPGEYLTVPPVPDPTYGGSPLITGPIGLGFRVPMIIVSPFSRGGLISSDAFDHTSLLRFIETRFGAEVPNLSVWRRSAVGDMTTALNFHKVDTSVPSIPAPSTAGAGTIAECAGNLVGFAPPQLPATQTMPTQEAGSPVRPNGAC
ncbi:MAG TPA: alkaline phosphatase family protein [Terracidiphilus sp.]|nr:alkaline phosphatase family protein [Terracidiphilus sp.]